MSDSFAGYNEDGTEVWVDYTWLRNGCINEMYFNWMYSLWTATNPDIREMVKEQSQFRKFIADDTVSWTSHDKRVDLVNVEAFNRYDLSGYIKQKGWDVL